MGGENGGGSLCICYLLGSSPRGRGKRGQVERPLQSAGLIPAWAGKTSSQPTALLMTRAHPRVGGEN